MISRIATRGARDDDVVTDPERLSGDALLTELPHATPFHGVAHLRPVLLFDVDVHEGMRVAEIELYEIAFNRDGFLFAVGGRKRMMRIRARAGQPYQRND